MSGRASSTEAKTGELRFRYSKLQGDRRELGAEGGGHVHDSVLRGFEPHARRMQVQPAQAPIVEDGG